MSIELIIFHKKKAIYPLVEDGIEWQTDREGTPSTLTFKLKTDKNLGKVTFEEGDTVRMKEDKHPIFFGFVFKKSRTSDGMISVTAYDQLRYLKNKVVYTYKGKTASQVIKYLAGTYNLHIGKGTIEDTKYKLPSRVEENVTLFDIINNALTLTLQHTGKMYVLYDDFGNLTLKSLANMKVKNGKNTYFTIDEDNAQDYSFESSIDGDTYDSIALYYSDNKSGEMTWKFKSDPDHMKQWGTLQYLEKVQSKTGMAEKAKQLLQLYNVKSRTLEVSGVKGYYKVRAGSFILFKMRIAGIDFRNFMLVEKAKHTFKNNEHTMTLNLRGGVKRGKENVIIDA